MHRFHEDACNPDADNHMSVTYQRAGLQRPTGRRAPGGRARPLNSRLGRTRAWHHGAPGWQHSASCRRRTLRRTPYWPASRSWRTAPRGPSHGQAGCTICTPHRLPLLMRQTPHAQLSMQGRVRRARQGLWKVISTQGVRARSTAARSRASQRARRSQQHAPLSVWTVAGGRAARRAPEQSRRPLLAVPERPTSLGHRGHVRDVRD